MASKIIGIDIGTDTVKLALCSGGTVKNLAVERMPENMVRDGKINSPAAMATFLKGVCKRSGIRPGPCALVLPTREVISHKVTMPVMNESELMLNLPFEFRDFVGKDADKYEYDYSVLGVKDNIMEIYAAAVPKRLIDDSYAMLRKAGFTLKVAVPVEMAWLNLIRGAKNAPERLCILDIGHSVTRVSIFADGHYEMGRDIELAGQRLNDIIAESQQIDPHVARTHKEANMDKVLSSDLCTDIYSELSIEVMKVINFYRSNAEGGEKLNDIFYCGGSSCVEGLRTAILKRTDMTMHHISRLVSAPGINEEAVLYCALAAGAGMQSE